MSDETSPSIDSRSGSGPQNLDHPPAHPVLNREDSLYGVKDIAKYERSFGHCLHESMLSWTPVDLAMNRSSLISAYFMLFACSCGLGLGQIIGYNGAAFLEIQNELFAVIVCFVSTSCILPYGAYRSILNNVPENSELKLVIVSILLGAVSGFGLSSWPITLLSLPPHACTVLAIPAMLYMMPSTKLSRSIFMAVMVSCIMIIGLIVGLIAKARNVNEKIVISALVYIINLQLNIGIVKEMDDRECILALLFGVVTMLWSDYSSAIAKYL